MPISDRYSAVHVVMSDYMRPIYMYCFMCSIRTSTGTHSVLHEERSVLILCGSCLLSDVTCQ